MTDLTLFVGLDGHKKTISVALVGAAASATVRFYGTIANTPDTLRGLSKRLSKDGEALHFCYEAGPCGYGVQRQLTRPHTSDRVHVTESFPISGIWY